MLNIVWYLIYSKSRQLIKSFSFYVCKAPLRFSIHGDAIYMKGTHPPPLRCARIDMYFMYRHFITIQYATI